MNMLKVLSLVVAPVLVFSSCSSRILDLDVCSSRYIDLSGATQYVTADAVQVEGVSRRHHFLTIPFGIPKFDEAVSEAIEAGGPHAVALANVKVDVGSWWIPILYGQTYFTLEANPILKKQALVEPLPQPAQ